MSGSLLSRFKSLLDLLSCIWAQDRTSERGSRMGLGHVLTLGTRTIARIIASDERDQEDWSGEYRLFAQAKWTTRELMQPVLHEAMQVAYPDQLHEQDPIWVAGDHTHIVRGGRHVAGVQTMRDPVSSTPYHVNLTKGLRFFHLSLLASPWRKEGALDIPARALPIRFEPSPTLRRPGKRATEEQINAYKKAVKERQVTKQALEDIRQLREDLNQAGASHRKLVCVLDGAFANKVFYRQSLAGIELISRMRKDAKLCSAAEGSDQGGRRFFGREKFTPEGVRQDETKAWSEVNVRTGGREHPISYKEERCYWQRGAGKRKVRVIVLKPTGYRLSKNSRLLYRDPAYLVCTDMELPIEQIVQGYVDRWQIEVAHREMKSDFGLADSQVRNAKSVSRHPAFVVAVYSLLHLAALKEHGPRRTASYLPLPKWNKGGVRPSVLEIVRLVRHEALQTGPHASAHTLVTKAAA